MPPKLTVILPAYNWSEALRRSIPSVLYQTFGDFELLVIGDHCTDDSHSVVASFSDPRVAWHNLPERAGSQSGPNNFGLRIARGEYVAYLGHDDVWHPGHLHHLLEAMERHQADLGCAVSVMYGPPGSGVRGLSGVFIEGVDRPSDFFPPSAMMHRRTLPAAVEGWKAPDSIGLPVDCDFLIRARAAGARIVSSGKLTAFKFNAAWRRDSYLRRDTTEQQELLRRLTDDPAACTESELIALLQATREKRLIETIIPIGAILPAGGIYHSYLQYRGLETAPNADLSKHKRLHPDSGFAGLEWHPPEDHPDWGTIRWSGPALESTIVIPAAPSLRFRLRIQILNLFNAPISEELRLFVNDAPVAYTVETPSPPAALLTSGPCNASGNSTRLRIASTRTRCPYFEWPDKSEDQRWLGVCFNWVEVEPVP
ncbi:MAG: glycosyltransferase family 2 protein [Bryobacteraceae bacterium]